MRVRVEGFWVAQKLWVEVIAFTSVTLTALGGFLIPGWDIVLNFTTREWERDGLGRLVMEIYKFSPPTRSKR